LTAPCPRSARPTLLAPTARPPPARRSPNTLLSSLSRWSYVGNSVGSTNKLIYVGDKHARMQACCTACIKMSSCKIWGACSWLRLWSIGRNINKNPNQRNNQTTDQTTNHSLIANRYRNKKNAEWQGLGDGKYVCKFFGAAAKKTPYRGPKGVGQMSGVVRK
jgi:hypothetical protein